MKRLILLLILAIGLYKTVFAESLISNGVVIQAGHKEVAELKYDFMFASNIREGLPKAKIEIVVCGANIKELETFSNLVPLIQKIQSEDIEIVACGKSLLEAHLTAEDLAPGITVVPFGGIHIVNRQKQGWQYIVP